ncbi:MAG: phosphoserine phosphatase RsbU/P [Chthoniobacter sp.]|jgi:sigma-B regulation protein RsbU (phosphoserine phosphatase)|nr:phosphoserine phosphatase RsbU/P [Chthoniobacter sp.]
MPSDFATLERQLKVYKGLVEVSALINAITNSSELLPAILDVARRVMEVEAASLFLVTPQGDLEIACASGSNGAVPAQRIIVPRGRGISGWVLENKRSLLVPDAYADPRFFRETDKQTGFRTRSILCVPLLRKGKEIGVLQVLNPIGRESFDAADLEVFEAYGTLAATAIDKLRTIERERQQERIRQEFAFAQEIQKSFLPQALPQHARANFAALYRPALNVGGDFYDVIEPGPNEIYFVVGDVSGKGMPAALLMAQALSILRLIVRPGISPIAAMARWNAMLTGHTIRGMFVTALLGRIDVESRQVELCSAGHCHPFRVDTEGKVEEIRIAGSPPLGLLPELPARSNHITLGVHEFLVTYTDGLTESFNAQDQLLDRTGVEKMLARPFSSSSELVEALNLGELRHRQNAEPHDDLTLLVFSLQ